MKNLIIWLSADHQFPREAGRLIRVQIENNHRLGIPPEDVKLITNFPYEYLDTKAIVVGDEHFASLRPRSINTSILPYLIDEGIISDGIYWNHDMDAYQINPMTDEELELEDHDAGLTDYGWKSRWCMGSFFVKPSSRDFFAKTIDGIFNDIEDEDMIQQVLDQNPEMAKRIKRMNITYNFGMRRVEENMERATKPVKVFHFHPHKPGLKEKFFPLMPPELVKIFNNHGYTI